MKVLVACLLCALGIASAVIPRAQSLQTQTCGAVKAEALQVINEEGRALVFISLPAPPVPSRDSLTQVRTDVSERQAAVLADLTTSDFTLTYQYRIAPALSGLLTATGAAKLDCSPDVLAVDVDKPLSVALSESAGVIDAPDVHLQGLDGTGIDVAVFDTGIDTNHPDLLDSISGEACFTDVPTEDGVFVVCPDDPSYPGTYSPGHPAEDGHGHGTHVSGIVTSNGTTPGVPKGIAPGARVFAYKVILDSGSLFLTWLAAGLDDALDNHAGEFELINMSIEQPGASYQPEQCDGDDSGDVYPAIAWLAAALRNTGTLAFAAAGNYGSKSGLSFPGCIPYVVPVGMTYDAPLGSRAWNNVPCTDTSTTADKVACASQSSAALDLLLAPGSEILSTWPFAYGVAFGSGTSQASPHAVGVAALLKDALPGLTPDEIVERLKETGKWVKDEFNDGDPATFRWTPRVDARVAILGDGSGDYDRDGCSDEREMRSVLNQGGLRNPFNPYDWYDINHDGAVSIPVDILQVAQAFGVPGNYLARKDRGAVNDGPFSWNKSAPNGSIDVPGDVLGVAQQYSSACLHDPNPATATHETYNSGVSYLNGGNGPWYIQISGNGVPNH